MIGRSSPKAQSVYIPGVWLFNHCCPFCWLFWISTWRCTLLSTTHPDHHFPNFLLSVHPAMTIQHPPKHVDVDYPSPSFLPSSDVFQSPLLPFFTPLNQLSPPLLPTNAHISCRDPWYGHCINWRQCVLDVPMTRYAHNNFYNVPCRLNNVSVWSSASGRSISSIAYQLILFLKGISYLFLMIHNFLLFILDECPTIDPKYKSRCIILIIIIELRMDVLGW